MDADSPLALNLRLSAFFCGCKYLARFSASPRFFKVAGVLLLSVLALHCGAVGEPHPPLLNVPERADDLAARQTPQGIVLEWTWPRVTTEGVLLNDLARFDVYALELAPGSPVPDAERFDRESRPLASMSGAALDAYSAGERVNLVLDAEPLMGKRVAVGVRAESHRGRSVGFSNLVMVDVIAPPGEPGVPSLTLAPGAIVVEWPAAARASAYVIERGADAAGPFEEIGRAESTEFRDARIQSGETYFYRVRALARSGEGEAEGPFSQAVSITPQDIFAPEKPVGLRAVATEAAVELSWEQSAAPDLAGYRVRRRQQASEARSLIHEDLLVTPGYSDRDAQRGQEYFYTVTAVDHTGNESAPSDALSVRVP